MRGKLLFLTFSSLLLLEFRGIAKISEHPTNLELTQRALEEAVNRVLEQLPSLDPKRVLLREEGESEGGWMVERTLAKHLRERGWDAALEELPASYEGGILAYRVVNLGIIYGKRHRKGILGKNLVERHAMAELSIILTGLPSREILWVQQVRGEATDEVPEDDLEVLKAGSFTFHPEELKQERRSLLEPLIVTALVGVLIYLFYSTKSTK